MHQIVDEAYVISVKEFITLLKGMGYENCYGMVSEEINFTKQEIISILKGLAEKDIITSNGEEFVLHDEYRKFMTSIGTADFVMVCNSNYGRNIFSLYIGDGVIVCKQSPNFTGTYCLEFAQKDSLGQLFYEELAIPRKLETEILNELLFEENIEENEQEIYSSTEIVNMETNEKVIVSIIKGFLSYYMIVKKGNEVVKSAYTEQKYKELLLEIIGGNIRW